MVYAMTMSEALRLETVSSGLIVLVDWLTNPPRSSQKAHYAGRVCGKTPGASFGHRAQTERN
jgi:hypothetical protein